MDLKQILNINTIKTHLSAKDKTDALEQLSTLLVNEGYVNDQEAFMTDIFNREALGMTGIGNYIAIPHGKSAAVSKIGVAIGIFDDELEWETLDDNGVKVVILFSVGNDNEGAQEHLKMLSMFSRKLGNDEVVEKLLKADEPAQVIETFM